MKRNKIIHSKDLATDSNRNVSNSSLYYDQSLEKLEPKVNEIFKLVKELFWEWNGEDSVWYHPREGLNEIKTVRRVAQELIKIADELQPTYAALEKVRQARKRAAFEAIEKKQAKVVGVAVHEHEVGGTAVCFRCISRLKNPDGTPFKLSQAGAEDLIFEDDNDPCSKRLKDEGCEYCDLETSLVPPEGVENESPYCKICHSPIVYL